MKSINFTDEELDHLRGYYQVELVEAEKDVERIKDILSKLGRSKPVQTEEITEKIPAKRGRKPKLTLEESPVIELKKRGRKPKVKVEDVIKKERKQRTDKGIPRGTRVSPVTEAAPVAEPFVAMAEPEPVKPLIPKKPKKKKQPKRRGITLAPMGRPLPKRAPEPELPAADPDLDSPEPDTTEQV